MDRHMTRWMLGAALAALAASVAGIGGAAAQAYPSRAITLIVPYPPGGPTDQLARTVAPILTERLGQSVIIENVTGGGTNIATQRVVHSAPDGYTLLIHNVQISANVSLYPTAPFNIERDLIPITMVNSNPLVLIGRNSLPANNLAELAAWMKTNIAKVGHPGIGSSGHLSTFLMAQAMGVTVDHIPYRGSAPILTDILGGHVDLTFVTPQISIEQVASGRMKAFTITSKEPSPQFPGVQTLAQVYGPKLEVLYWHAMFAPAGTPRPIVDRLNAEMQAIMTHPAVLKEWAKSGVVAFPKEQRTPEGAAAYIKSQIAHWGEVVRANNIEPSGN